MARKLLIGGLVSAVLLVETLVGISCMRRWRDRSARGIVPDPRHLRHGRTLRVLQISRRRANARSGH